jgi:type IV pilus assembly protein PilX
MVTKSGIVRRGQQGAALVIGLIMLALLSILGVGAYSMATMEERMAGNARDQIRAFEAAEASLRDCETQLLGNPAFTNSGGFYQGKTASTTDWWEDVNWLSSSAVRTLTTPTLEDVALQPRCIVERLQLVQMTPPGSSLRTGVALEEVQVYRASARGYGLNRSTEAFVQSTYRR